jgi:hypothetical protein
MNSECKAFERNANIFERTDDFARIKIVRENALLHEL